MLTVQDRLDILEVAARYAHCADRRDGDGFADCFTETGRLQFGETDLKGRAALKSLFAGAAASKSRHCNMNHVVQGEGNRATHECYVVLFSFETGPIVPAFVGHYRDSLEKSADGRWRIAERIAVQSA